MDQPLTLLGLRTTIYAVSDLAAATAWTTAVVGHGPYFDQPFYVGFEIGGFELGLLPTDDPALAGQVRSYWGVPDAEAAWARLLAGGAEVVEALFEPGDGIKIGGVRGPGGAFFGIIENPVFELAPVASDGPGR